MRQRLASCSLLLVCLFLFLSRATPANAQCVQGNFFVSTSVPGFFPTLAPPNGFCVVDNGAGDSDPAVGVIRFNQTVTSAATGTKVFTGAARIIPGTPITGGANNFGVELFDLQEDTLSVPAGSALAIPIFVQNTFTSNIPSPAYAGVTTSLTGFASSVTIPFTISDLGTWSSVPVSSSGHSIGISSSTSFSPPPVTSPFVSGLISPEVVTYQYQSTARPTGTRVNVTSGKAIVGATGNATDCVPGKFFVSSFVENFFTNLMPPAGFCIVDNGADDLDPAIGVIVFQKTVIDPVGLARKQFTGRAEVIPGSSVLGGETDFGVRLVNFQELPLGAEAVAGAPGIPVFVQNTVSPGIPAGSFGAVTTSLSGAVSSGGRVNLADLGSWAGIPVVSSGHIMIGFTGGFAPPPITSPSGSGGRSQEVVTYQYISTNRESGLGVSVAGGQAVVGLAPPPGPNQGPFLGLQPQVATNPVGAQHTVTASLSPAAAGTTVTFTVTGGPHAGVTGTAVTDVFGNASFSYTGTNEGTDAIQATAPGALASNTVSKEWVPDDENPICALVSASGGTLRVRVQDLGTGLDEVIELQSNNASVNTPAFPVGTTAQQIVTATKIDPTKPSQVQLRVIDVAGNSIDCDPVHVVVGRTTGRPEPVVLTGLPQAEDRVSLRNGTPGARNLEIEVNGRTWRITGLADGAERKLDISSAMRPGNENTIVLTAYGKPGSSVEVLVSE